MDRSLLTKERLVAAAVCALTFVILFASAPTNGGFWDSESARNPLNGAFIKDLLIELPFSDPVGWAYSYYHQYPALTILFYPPLLYFFIALFYMVFGVGHAAAVATVSTFGFCLALGLFVLSRRILSFPSALGFATVASFAPAMALSSRHVMLETPAMAFFVWSLVCLTSYLEDKKVSHLIWAVLLALATIYTKQTVFYLALIFLIALYWKWRQKIFFDRQIVIAGLLGVVGTVPLALIQLKFASFNITSVVNRKDIGIDSLSLEGIFFYFWEFPEALGLPATVLLCISVIGLAIAGMTGKLRYADRGTLLIFLLWFGLGLLLLLVVSLKNQRHGVPIYIPALLPIFLFIDTLGRHYLRYALLGGLTIFVAAETFYSYPVPEVKGYREAARLVADKARVNGRVAFSGNRDGSFIFNMRTFEDRRDISIVRVDKLLLNVRIMPQLGLHGNNYGIKEISSMLDRYGIEYIVAVPNQWIEEPVMANFQAVLDSAQFDLVKTIKIDANVGTEEKELAIYRNTHSLPEKPDKIRIKLMGGEREI